MKTVLADCVERVGIDALRRSPRNARSHSNSQIRKIADSIQRFGFIVPIVIDAGGRIIAGHGREAAARLLGLKTVPVIRVEHLSDAEKRAFMIADNRIAELAGWDRDLLRLEFEELLIEEPDLDLSLTGFEIGEIDQIVLGADATSADPAEDEIPSSPEAPPISRAGDLWLLGRHRVLCGDARSQDAYDRLLDGAKADMVITDPPYNVAIPGNVRGLGRHRFGNFAMAAGEMSGTEFTAFLEAVLRCARQASSEGALAFTFMDWRHLMEALSAGRAAYGELINICVWVKANGGMGSLYRSQHELVLVWRAGRQGHRNNVRLGKFGRNRSNVWHCAGANSFGAERDDMLALHPTVKPVALVAGAILDASRPNDIVLDPFLGSGTALIAAEKTGRNGVGLELDPGYVDTIVRRFERYTGVAARHAESGLTFAREAAERISTPTAEQSGADERSPSRSAKRPRRSGRAQA